MLKGGRSGRRRDVEDILSWWTHDSQRRAVCVGEVHLVGDVCGHTGRCTHDVETHKLLNIITSCVAPDNFKDFDTQKSRSLRQSFNLARISLVGNSLSHFETGLSYFERNFQLRDDFKEQTNRFSVYLDRRIVPVVCYGKKNNSISRMFKCLT